MKKAFHLWLYMCLPAYFNAILMELTTTISLEWLQSFNFSYTSENVPKITTHGKKSLRKFMYETEKG